MLYGFSGAITNIMNKYKNKLKLYCMYMAICFMMIYTEKTRLFVFQAIH